MNTEDDRDAQRSDCDVVTSAWTADDVAHLYRLVLDRGAETREILEEMATWDLRRLVGSFFHAPEFNQTVGVRLRAGERPRDGAPSAELCRWASCTMPLSDQGRQEAAIANRSWSALYLALAVDPVFRSYLDDDSALTEQTAFEALTATAALEGHLEEATAGAVRGWAVLPDTPDEAVVVEVWINGVFCCVGATHAFRRDVQDRFGGAGLAGFDIALPETARRRFPRMDIEVRASNNRFVFGRASVASEPAQPDLISGLRDEIAQTRRLLEDLENRLPWVESTLSSPVADYTAYNRIWRNAGPPAPPTDLSISVLLDVSTASILDMAEAANSIADQSHLPSALLLIARPDQAPLVADLQQRLSWRGQIKPAVLILEDADPVARLQMALEATDSDLVLPLTGELVLHGQALARIAARFAASRELDAVYVDEDVFHPEDKEDSAQSRRRISPRLKPDFDTDYLLQTPYAGEVVAFRTTALRERRLRAEAAPHTLCDVLLRTPPAAIVSVVRTFGTTRGVD